jgi:hypothetical protein
MNSKTKVPRWMTALVVGAAVIVLIVAGFQMAQRPAQFSAAYPGPEGGETEQLSPVTSAPTALLPTVSLAPATATTDPSLPTLIPPDATLAAFQMPPCCGNASPVYETPSPHQAALLTQAAQALQGPTLPPGAPTETSLPPLEYRPPSGKWAVYTNPNSEYHFEYPDNWYVSEDFGMQNGIAVSNYPLDQVAKVSDDPARTKITILADTLGSHVSLEGYVNDPQRVVPTARLISQASETLPSGYLVIRQRQNASTELLVLYLSDSSRVFTFITTAGSTYVNVVDHMMNSFVVTQVP